MRKHLIYVQFYNMSQLNLCCQEILCILSDLDVCLENENPACEESVQAGKL